MNNPEILATLVTQDTERRQTKQGATRNEQPRDTGNIGYTRHRTKTNKTRGNQEWTTQRYWQHWLHKTQNKNKQNKKYNTETHKDEKHGPHQKPGMNPGAHER
jgi:hypothetical protein